jgi:Cu(I)/Ag(I) efflux system membrane fusion protein
MNSAEHSSVPNPIQHSTKQSRWRKVRFALQAIEVRLRFVGILVVIGLLFAYWDTLQNHWDKWTRPENLEAALAPDKEFFCPMHPQVVRDTLEPNGSIPKCPICSMPLSERKKGEKPKLPEGVLSRVQFSPDRVKMAGLETIPASYQPLVQEIRTVGYVTYDESRLSRIVTRTSGYIEKLHINKTFATVTKGEELAEIYSPDLYKAAQEIVLLKEGQLQNLIETGRERLRLLGISDSEIDGILESGKAESRLVIRSPQAGHIIRKEIVEGSSLKEGDVLFEVADLSMVWIEAEVYEKDIPFLKQGQKIEATVEAHPGQVFEGTVSVIHPHLERATRTNRVRFELENPKHELRPGMYATVRIKTPVAELESFANQIAKRRMKPAADDTKGLIAWQQKCPVTNLKLGSMGKPLPVEVASETVMICCPACKDRLTTSPQKYLDMLAPPPEDQVLTVPQHAVIDTGTRHIVYVEREPGTFEGVEVVLGPRSGERYPVLSGLSPGEKIAAAGAFLIDAETRLNPAAASAYFGATSGPQTGSSSHSGHAP